MCVAKLLAKHIAPHATTMSKGVKQFVYKLKVPTVSVQVLLLSARPNDRRPQPGRNDGGTLDRFLRRYSVFGDKWNGRAGGGEEGG